ncbi:alpha/beta hydrolase [Deinococcus sp.]|uniref:alpha/beta fold hydrolase n=1 Tax=Deinococcus sp. TaxID=47478 RepID=UPI0025BA12E9|nr:alpha/beta hydrolase [Deinococcus sp.]
MTEPKPQTVLMLHAYPLSGTMWSAQEKALQEAGRNVIVPHLPGFGGTSGHMSSLADTAAHLLELLGPQPVSLVGLSMGGYLALALLRLAPERFGRVVLADTSAAADDAQKQQDRRLQAQRVRAEGREFILEAAQKEHSPATYERILPMMQAASREGVAAALEAMAERPESFDVLEKLKVPLLVLVGERDEITPLGNARKLVEAGHGELKIIPDAAHLANLDNAHDFTRALLDFLT